MMFSLFGVAAFLMPCKLYCLIVFFFVGFSSLGDPTFNFNYFNCAAREFVRFVDIIN